MKQLLALITIALVVISRTAGEMTLSEITMTTSGDERRYTGTVSNAVDTELQWHVNGITVVFSFIDTASGNPELENPSDPIFITNETLYGFSYTISGMNVTSTLTIKKVDGYGDVKLTIKNAERIFLMTSSTESTAANDVSTAVASTFTTPTEKNVTMYLSKITMTQSGDEQNYTVTAYFATKTDLNWKVENIDVVSASINVDKDGSVNETEPITNLIISNETLYGVFFEISGTDNVTMTLNVKSKHGYGDVTLTVSTMNLTLSMPSVSATPEATVKPVTSKDELQGTDSSVAPETSMMSTDGNSVTATSETAVTTECDVGGQNCNESIVFNCSREIVTMESCTVSWKCGNGRYIGPNITCEGKHACPSLGVWGVNCDKTCGGGCNTLTNYSAIHICDATTGQCLSNMTKQAMMADNCAAGWEGNRCEIPICSQGCNGGVCLAPNFCGNCPRHHESGVTCRNISLDGFSKGSLPTLVILGAVVIILKIASDYYDRTKKKRN